MEIVSFTKADQSETEAFLNTIYEEMGWEDLVGEASDLLEYFHIPERGFFLLVKDGGNVVGTAGCLMFNHEEGLMKRFYIHKKHRGTGTATKLLNEFIRTAKTMNINRIVLDVSTNNERAIRFYEKNGFQKYDQKPIALWPESSQPKAFYYYFLEIK